MPVIEEGIEQLLQEFAEEGIPISQPGFHQDPSFIRCEHKDPTYLEKYVRFVQHQQYSQSYQDQAALIIQVVSEELQWALHQEQSPEAYNEAPLVMSRILEREGVWNYVASGGLTLTFPAGSGFEPFTLPAMTMQYGKPADCAYRWIVAPPFQVIDITIQACNCPNPIHHLLPKLVWDAGEPVIGEPGDIFSDAMLKEIAKAGMTTDQALDRYLPDYRSVIAANYPARLITWTGTQLKYVPTAVSVADVPLKHCKGFRACGLSAAQIYSARIRPRIK